MMDWHRCIGCRYCIAGCPYGSRSFNWRDPRPFLDELSQRLALPTELVASLEAQAAPAPSLPPINLPRAEVGTVSPQA